MSPRKFDSEIHIDAHDRWIFRGNEITQVEILKYFRQNLKQNEKGVFIENVFGELSENGFLKILGYPCHITGIRFDDGELFLHGDDEQIFKFPEFEIYQTKEGHLMGLHASKDLVRYRFDWNAASQLGEHLSEEGDMTFLNLGSLQMELPLFEGEIEVTLPDEYL